MKRLLFALLIAAAPAHAASIQDLLRAYPDALAGVEGNTLVWRDGTRMPIDDNAGEKTDDEKLQDGSIRDQLSLPYPGPGETPTTDPGRIRNRAFFEKMYGDCHAGEVAPHLARIPWPGGGSITITSVNGIDRRLAAVGQDLADRPDLQKYLRPLGGTYACRDVADTGRTSMHAWGAAIDISTRWSDYWLWRRNAPYRNRIPDEIVAAFAHHGFIWGGNWAHYDTMHFEYRPELLPYDPKSE